MTLSLEQLGGQVSERLMVKWTIYLIIYFLAAPSAPPTFVSTSKVTSSSISLHWGPVDCIQRNGDISGYTVQYEVQGSGNIQNKRVSGNATNEVTILELNVSANYNIQVAAVNSAGVGVYSVGKCIILTQCPIVNIVNLFKLQFLFHCWLWSPQLPPLYLSTGPVLLSGGQL